ncbi:hypothetical protein SAMN05216387_10775 [Nitrosovibrio tenuis]|uniref:Uncharacterized protein n=1 Tax=Nitrosovibrio tenuis TaxID=1233 RepID=A0A1H7NNB3_9PROT|nr:hypothetical protein SAMN05216387_10775 [Nitrosovibrio tenuis]
MPRKIPAPGFQPRVARSQPYNPYDCQIRTDCRKGEWQVLCGDALIAEFFPSQDC